MNVSKRQQGTGVSVPEPRRASALLRRGGVVVARHTSLISSSSEMTFTGRAWTDRKVKERFGSEREREIGTESDSEREIRVNDLL